MSLLVGTLLLLATPMHAQRHCPAVGAETFQRSSLVADREVYQAVFVIFNRLADSVPWRALYPPSFGREVDSAAASLAALVQGDSARARALSAILGDVIGRTSHDLPDLVWVAGELYARLSLPPDIAAGWLASPAATIDSRLSASRALQGWGFSPLVVAASASALCVLDVATSQRHSPARRSTTLQDVMTPGERSLAGVLLMDLTHALDSGARVPRLRQYVARTGPVGKWIQEDWSDLW